MSGPLQTDREIADLRERVARLEGQLHRVAAALLELPAPNPAPTPNSARPPASSPAPPALASHNPAWFPVIHTDPACLKPAYYLIRRFGPQEMADLACMRVRVQGEPSWRVPNPDDVPACSSCFAPIHPFGSQGLDFSRAITPAHPQPPVPADPRFEAPVGSPLLPAPEGPFKAMDPRAFSDISAMIGRLKQATEPGPPPPPAENIQEAPEGTVSARLQRSGPPGLGDDGPGR